MKKVWILASAGVSFVIFWAVEMTKMVIKSQNLLKTEAHLRGKIEKKLDILESKIENLEEDF